jgi:hypothetical protein
VLGRWKEKKKGEKENKKDSSGGMVDSLYLRVIVTMIFAWPTTGFLSLPPTTTRASLSVLCADASARGAGDGGWKSFDPLSRRSAVSLVLRSLTVPLLTAVKNAEIFSLVRVSERV